MNSEKTSGVDFTDLLTIVFIVLKLCGIIAWSWWWVLSPLWISAIGWVILLIIVLLIGGKK
uniref:Transmembrane protein n=1 Tax=Siphoviridae sp. ctTDf8 TaxID=2825517 RepID=A0A8S5UJ26_9CAUD|nr:MAG TPA: transmembrane protein [Siphoviridae sp. ctTDf8]